jgi:hypothetical protein
MLNPYRRPRPRKPLQPRRPKFNDWPKAGIWLLPQSRPYERIPAGGGYRVIRQPKLLDEE